MVRLRKSTDERHTLTARSQAMVSDQGFQHILRVLNTNGAPPSWRLAQSAIALHGPALRSPPLPAACASVQHVLTRRLRS